MDQDHHYFVSTAFGWAVAETQDEAVRKAAFFVGESTFKDYARIKEFVTGTLLKVTRPMSVGYTIDNFLPHSTKIDGRLVPVPYEKIGRIKILNYKGKWQIIED